jgi:hypothetical protein
MHIGKEQNHWVIQYLTIDFPNQEKESICIFKKMLLQPAYNMINNLHYTSHGI